VQARFVIQADEEDDPIRIALECLATARIHAIAPEGSELSTEKWGVPTATLPATSAFPFALPNSPATLPLHIECERKGEPVTVAVEHWGDSTSRDNVKFWAGAGGYPGAALFRDALDLVRTDLVGAAEDPFALSKPQSSSFRFDWRRDYIPLDAGFSPNEHGSLVMVGFPVVELLAAIGLSNARPKRAERNKLEYRYGVLGRPESGDLYDPVFLRAALGGADLNLPRRNFAMRLGWPGQENQARCIIDVTEETDR
jgi:CRISPR-associated protein Csx14